MLDRDLTLDAIEDAQRILAEHIQPGSHRNPETTINMLLFLLDRREVVAAVRRLRDGYGLRVGGAQRKTRRREPASRPAAKALTNPQAVTVFVCQLTKR